MAGTAAGPNPAANFAAHWNGTTLERCAVALPGGEESARLLGNSISLNELTAVTALSGSDAWASGSEGNVNDTNLRDVPGQCCPRTLGIKTTSG